MRHLDQVIRCRRGLPPRHQRRHRRFRPKKAWSSAGEAEEQGSVTQKPVTDRMDRQQEIPSTGQTGFLVLWGQADTEERREPVFRSLETWRDIFCEHISDMSRTGIIEHRIPTYLNTIPGRLSARCIELKSWLLRQRWFDCF